MIEKYNFHWREGFFYQFPKKRKLFDDLAKELFSKQIIALIGMRRTGKTTLLKQLIDNLIQHNIKREHILFYSFDEEQLKVNEVMHEYETKMGKPILELKERIYVFFDEIQKLEDWQNQIKYYYDHYSNIKFFVSGSSSLFIKKHIQESLAGRIYEFVLKPLSFNEFLLFRGKEDLLKKNKLFEEMLQKEFAAYQKRQFIEIVNEDEEKVGQYVKSMIEKIIYQDIPKIFPIEHEELLMKLLTIISSQPGMLSNYEDLARELSISRITLSNYLFYLEESFLVKKLYNFSKNRLTSEKKMKRFYLSTTSFFPFLNNAIDEAKLIENLLVVFLDTQFFWRTPQQYEVDMVLLRKEEIIPLEVKYKHTLVEKDFKHLLKFCEKFNAERAFIITKNEENEKQFQQGKRTLKVILIPAWKFLLQENMLNISP